MKAKHFNAFLYFRTKHAYGTNYKNPDSNWLVIMNHNSLGEQ